MMSKLFYNRLEPQAPKVIMRRILIVDIPILAISSTIIVYNEWLRPSSLGIYLGVYIGTIILNIITTSEAYRNSKFNSYKRALLGDLYVMCLALACAIMLPRLNPYQYTYKGWIFILSEMFVLFLIDLFSTILPEAKKARS